MANDVQIYDASGTLITIATDEIGGKHYQRTKLGLGSEDAYTELAPGQQAKAASLSVTLASDHDPVPIAGRTVELVVTPTISTTAYANADAIGGLMQFTGAARSGVLSGVIDSVVVADASAQAAPMDLILFNASPGTTTGFADNGVFSIADADLPKVVGRIAIAATDYVVFGTTANAVAIRASLSTPYVLSGGTTLWVAARINAIKTFAAGALTLKLYAYLD